MHIRSAETKDVGDIIRLGKDLLKIHEQLDPGYYRLEDDFDVSFGRWVRSCLGNPNQFIFVAKKDAKIIGFISGFIKFLYPWFHTKTVGHISYMIVDKAYRNQGIGKLLEQAAADYFLSKKISYMELYVDEKNELGQKAWSGCRYLPFKKFLRRKLF